MKWSSHFVCPPFSGANMARRTTPYNAFRYLGPLSAIEAWAIARDPLDDATLEKWNPAIQALQTARYIQNAVDRQSRREVLVIRPGCLRAVQVTSLPIDFPLDCLNSPITKSGSVSWMCDCVCAFSAELLIQLRGLNTFKRSLKGRCLSMQEMIMAEHLFWLLTLRYKHVDARPQLNHFSDDFIADLQWHRTRFTNATSKHAKRLAAGKRASHEYRQRLEEGASTTDAHAKMTLDRIRALARDRDAIRRERARNAVGSAASRFLEDHCYIRQG